MIRIKIISIIALLGLALAVSAQCPLRIKGGDAVSVGLYIAPVDRTAMPVVEHDSGRLLTPASIMKSLTMATALELLGPDFRWNTRVMAHGNLSHDGTLNGDIVIIGSGDPTLESRHFKEHPSFVASLVNAVKAHGIKTIRGKIRIYDAAVPHGGAVPSWEVEDIAWDYGAGTYAINYADNTFTLQIPSMQVYPPVPGLKIVDRREGQSGKIDISRGAGSDILFIYGSLGARKQASFPCSMPDPGSALVQMVESRLVAAGIAVEREDVPQQSFRPGCGGAVEILSFDSPPLRDVGRSLMVRSDNLMAEATLRALASGMPLKNAIQREIRFWHDKGVDLSCSRINDGSGLSRANAVSAAQLGAVLRAMAVSPQRNDYVDVFARVGLDGTMRSFLNRHERKGEFVLKSGSMGGVQCYAGYRIDPESRIPTHVIVVMVNNLVGSRTELRKAVETLLLDTAY